jgi:hypothetical protein
MNFITRSHIAHNIIQNVRYILQSFSYFSPHLCIHYCRVLQEACNLSCINLHSGSLNSISDTQENKSKGYKAAPTTRAAIETSGFFPCVSEMELGELECRIMQLKLHASCKTWQFSYPFYQEPFDSSFDNLIEKTSIELTIQNSN